MSLDYTFEEHQHRLAAWAAARAFSRGLRGASAEASFDLLQEVGIDSRFRLDSLPEDQDRFDKEHRRLCKALISRAQKQRLQLSHGRAAKLLNAYFKVRFVCGRDHKLPVIRLMHPPIDRLLLEGLAKCSEGAEKAAWGKFVHIGWTRFDCETYGEVIDRIRKRVDGHSLWTIERFWPGHR